MQAPEWSRCSATAVRNRSGPQKQPQHQNSDLLTLRYALRVLDRSPRVGKQSTFALLVEKCCKLKALPEAKRLHSHISRRFLNRNIFLANFIISMYGHCGSVSDARLMFDSMHKRNVVSWNAMIAVYGQHGHGKRALRLLKQMSEDGLQPTKSTFITALNACTHPDLLKRLISLHKLLSKRGHENDLVVGNALINAYGKCGSAKEARKVFHKMRERDIVSWNSMVSAFSQNGHLKKALELIDRMKARNIEPDRVTFVHLLSGCTSKKDLEMGKVIYQLLLKNGYQSNVFVGTALITMFGKCVCLNDAREIFVGMRHRSVVTWNAMIVAYTQCGYNKEALQLFQDMRKSGVKPDKVTFTTILDACEGTEDLEEGRTIHFYAKECEVDQDVSVRSALVKMYGKCKSLEEAQHVFKSVEPPDLVLIAAMIGVYAQLGRGEEAIDMFCWMAKEGVKPNEVTYLNVLSVCAGLNTAVEGKKVHSGLIEGGFDSVKEVGNALVSMYSNCGCVEDARKVFDKTQIRTVVSWSAMLDAYASHGYGKEALDIFRRMQQDGVKPDALTFVSVLTACSRAGLILQAREHFFSMSLSHGIKPSSSHIMCMIDMFAGIGRLDEAETFIKKASFNVGVVEWVALLDSCRNVEDVERAERVAEQVLILDPLCLAAYAVLSDVYRKAGRQDDIARLKTRMEQHGLEKQIV
ncbi:hypothetical protein L7F22_059572 [Adiantum nelumboides]|nr:hypothetical protein [Adiantum nelumboides]MCO5605388.1 hypothetical protein [Adiantum nelumboides]